ncbi:MAG: hypothetical protein ABI439_07325, partial [Rhodospirillales bacterium]
MRKIDFKPVILPAKTAQSSALAWPGKERGSPQAAPSEFYAAAVALGGFVVFRVFLLARAAILALGLDV